MNVYDRLVCDELIANLKYSIDRLRIGGCHFCRQADLYNQILLRYRSGTYVSGEPSLKSARCTSNQPPLSKFGGSWMCIQLSFRGL